MLQMIDGRNLVDIAIQRLKAFEPPEGYYVAFSGGKDSQCIYHLCKMAGVKFDAHYSVTGVDPPELVKFIKEHYPDVSREIPRDSNGQIVTMWRLIPKKLMPPTRLVRYCCEALKENGGKDRVTLTGVRWAESARRKAKQAMVVIQGRNRTVYNDENDESRRMVEQCYRTRKTLVNPIVDWKDEDVWEFLNNVAKVPHCELYDLGYKRLGCIGCPMATDAERELERYPKYKDAYLRAFDRMMQNREKCGLVTETWKNADDVMRWWLGKETAREEAEGQVSMFEEAET